jgi:hypothetical protein
MSINLTKAEKILIKETENAEISHNKVLITGAVVHKYIPNNGKAAIITMATNTGSNSNYPKVVWYGKQARDVIEDMTLEKGNYPHICITAFVQTQKREVNGEVKYYQNIVGQEMESAPKAMEAQIGIEVGSKYVPDVNSVYLVGEIVHLFTFYPKNAGKKKDENQLPLGTILTIKTTTNGRISFPKVTFFREQANKARSMNVGDVAAIYGAVQTDKREENGQAQYFETIIGSDIDYFAG